MLNEVAHLKTCTSPESKAQTVVGESLLELLLKDGAMALLFVSTQNAYAEAKPQGVGVRR